MATADHKINQLKLMRHLRSSIRSISIASNEPRSVRNHLLKTSPLGKQRFRNSQTLPSATPHSFITIPLT